MSALHKIKIVCIFKPMYFPIILRNVNQHDGEPLVRIYILVWEDQFFYLLNAKPPGAAQLFVPVRSDTAVQAKLHRDSRGHPLSGCSGPSCYWCPEGLGTEHDPPNSHPDTGHNAPLHPQLSMVAGVLSLLWLILRFHMYFYRAGHSCNYSIYMHRHLQLVLLYFNVCADSKFYYKRHGEHLFQSIWMFSC